MTDIATRATRRVASPGGRRRLNGGGPRAGTIFAFVIPFFLPFVLFYLLPVGYARSGRASASYRRTGGQYGTSYTTFGGFEQYTKVFQNDEFWSSVGRIGLFGIVRGAGDAVRRPGDRAAARHSCCASSRCSRITAFMPYAVPGVIAAIMWSYLYSAPN
ncbi:hypothetical protein ACRAWF_38525 [Streptomyces sp. L7]